MLQSLSASFAFRWLLGVAGDDASVLQLVLLSSNTGDRSSVSDVEGVLGVAEVASLKLVTDAGDPEEAMSFRLPVI